MFPKLFPGDLVWLHIFRVLGATVREVNVAHATVQAQPKQTISGQVFSTTGCDDPGRDGADGAAPGSHGHLLGLLAAMAGAKQHL